MSGATLFEPRVGEEAEVVAEEVAVGDSSVAAVRERGCRYCWAVAAVAVGSYRVQLEWFQAEEASDIVLAGGVLGAALAEVVDGAVTGVEAVMGAAG